MFFQSSEPEDGEIPQTPAMSPELSLACVGDDFSPERHVIIESAQLEKVAGMLHGLSIQGFGSSNQCED
jgi:hypothetical protein